MDTKLVLFEEKQSTAADELSNLEERTEAEKPAAEKPAAEKSLEKRLATLEHRVTNYIENTLADLHKKLVAQESTIKDLIEAQDSLQRLQALKKQIVNNSTTTSEHSERRAPPEETEQGSDSSNKWACHQSSQSPQA
jgi:uncharacterized coiled-coil protein SlyX